MKVMPKKEIEALIIQIRVSEKPALYILLSRDGAVNRMGSGRVNETEKDLYIGQLPEDCLWLDEVLEVFPSEALLNPAMAYDIGEISGEQCVLEFLAYSGDERAGVAFRYGSESVGPPEDICDAVRTAIAVTQDWYQNFRELAGKTA